MVINVSLLAVVAWVCASKAAAEDDVTLLQQDLRRMVRSRSSLSSFGSVDTGTASLSVVDDRSNFGRSGGAPTDVVDSSAHRGGMIFLVLMCISIFVFLCLLPWSPFAPALQLWSPAPEDTKQMGRNPMSRQGNAQLVFRPQHKEGEISIVGEICPSWHQSRRIAAHRPQDIKQVVRNPGRQAEAPQVDCQSRQGNAQPTVFTERKDGKFNAGERFPSRHHSRRTVMDRSEDGKQEERETGAQQANTLQGGFQTPQGTAQPTLLMECKEREIIAGAIDDDKQMGRSPGAQQEAASQGDCNAQQSNGQLMVLRGGKEGDTSAVGLEGGKRVNRNPGAQPAKAPQDDRKTEQCNARPTVLLGPKNAEIVAVEIEDGRQVEQSNAHPTILVERKEGDSTAGNIEDGRQVERNPVARQVEALQGDFQAQQGKAHAIDLVEHKDEEITAGELEDGKHMEQDPGARQAETPQKDCKARQGNARLTVPMQCEDAEITAGEIDDGERVERNTGAGQEAAPQGDCKAPQSDEQPTFLMENKDAEITAGETEDCKQEEGSAGLRQAEVPQDDCKAQHGNAQVTVSVDCKEENVAASEICSSRLQSRRHTTDRPILCPELVVPPGRECVLAVPSLAGLARGQAIFDKIYNTQGKALLHVGLTSAPGGEALVGESEYVVLVQMDHKELAFSEVVQSPTDGVSIHVFHWDGTNYASIEVRRNSGSSAADKTGAAFSVVPQNERSSWRLFIEGDFKAKRIKVVSNSGEVVAATEPYTNLALEPDNPQDFYRVRLLPYADACLVVVALLSVERALLDLA